MKKILLMGFVLCVCGLALPLTTPNVAITFGVGDGLATSIVNYVLAASDVVAIISMIGIVFGVGGVSLAAVQTIRYLAKKKFAKAVAW